MDKELIRRYFNDAITPEEERLVTRWLSDPSLKEDVFVLIDELWREEKGEQLPVPLFEDVLKQAMVRDQQAAKVVMLQRNRKVWAIAAAACVAFLVAGIGIGYNLNRKKVIEVSPATPVIHYTVYPAPVNERAVVMLSNGTEVRLKEKARLVVDDANSAQQTVYLEGEASFKLHEGNKTVVIKTKDLVTTARASELKISASPADSLVVVSVDKGEAEVKSNTETFFPLVKLKIPAKKDSSAIALNEPKEEGSAPKILPLMKLRPIVVKEKGEVTFNKNNGLTDLE